MKDLEIILENKIGTLAFMGEVLGKNNISLLGGGVFANGLYSIAHFLLEEPEKAKSVLQEVGFNNIKINDVIILKLKQGVPGQLGMFCRKIADAGINILTQYSDHYNQLIIIVDNYEKARQVADEWMKISW